MPRNGQPNNKNVCLNVTIPNIVSGTLSVPLNKDVSTPVLMSKPTTNLLDLLETPTMDTSASALLPSNIGTKLPRHAQSAQNPLL
jgi:hypothetical protein